jgi:hypothetical protein
MALQVADIYLEDQFVEKPGETAPGSPSKAKFIKLPGSALKQKAGAYREIKSGRIWRVDVKGEKLEVTSSSGFVFHISPLSAAEFQAVDAPLNILITFIPPETPGKQAQMKVKIADREPDIYETVSLVSPTPGQLEEYTGNYYSDELEVTYKLLVREKQLVLKEKYITETTPMKPTVKDEFQVPGGTAKFIRDKGGRVSGFNVAAGRVKNIGFVKR